MKKSTIKMLSIGLAVSIPLCAIIVKKHAKQAPMVAKEMKREEVLTKITVENDEYYKTISIHNDDLYVSDLPNMYYLTNDRINYLLCRREEATRIDLDTEENRIEYVYHDINNDKYIIDYKNYEILSPSEFERLYGVSNLKTRKLTIID